MRRSFATLRDWNNSQGLDDLELDRCIDAELLPIVGMLKNLRELSLNRCGTLPSIKFLHDLPKLERLAFVDTDVIDGDLSPLLRLQVGRFFGQKTLLPYGETNRCPP